MALPFVSKQIFLYVMLQIDFECQQDIDTICRPNFRDIMTRIQYVVKVSPNHMFL